LLERISGDLKQRGIRGLGISMLRNCRLIYRLYPQIRQALSGDSGPSTLPEIRQSPIGEFDKGAGAQPIKPGNGPTPLGTLLLCLSWTVSACKLHQLKAAPEDVEIEVIEPVERAARGLQAIELSPLPAVEHQL
jgi:hypothetical protein